MTYPVSQPSAGGKTKPTGSQTARCTSQARETDQARETEARETNGFGVFATSLGLLGLLSTGLVFSIVLFFLASDTGVTPAPLAVRWLILWSCLFMSGATMLCAGLGWSRSPRKYAILGACLGWIPLGGFVGIDHYVHLHVQNGLRSGKSDQDPRQAENQRTERSIQQAIASIIEFRHERGRLPGVLEGNRLVVHKKDCWENELRYEPIEQGFTIRSAGADGVFENGDDRTRITRIETMMTISAT